MLMNFEIYAKSMVFSACLRERDTRCLSIEYAIEEYLIKELEIRHFTDFGLKVHRTSKGTMPIFDSPEPHMCQLLSTLESSEDRKLLLEKIEVTVK